MLQTQASNPAHATEISAQRLGFRRPRRGSVRAQDHRFVRIDRNERVRIKVYVQAMEGKTRPKGYRAQGAAKSSGIALVDYYLFHRMNLETGRCDPSIVGTAEDLGMAQSTVVAGNERLEALGVMEVVRRRGMVVVKGQRREVQLRNSYVFRMPSSDSGLPHGTTGEKKKKRLMGGKLPEIEAAIRSRDAQMALFSDAELAEMRKKLAERAERLRRGG